jgi:precorrin-6Y C5,15-methyltransferase (decarboxylating)
MTAPRFAWPIAAVGLLGGVPYGAGAQAELVECDVLVGARRNLDAVGNPDAERIDLDGSLDVLLDVVADRAAAGHRVCILASGDPGFFGIVRALAERFGSESVSVHPAPSSVALAFARLGLPWDDADVVSVQADGLAAVVATVSARPKVAILMSPDVTPEHVGKVLLDSGCGARDVAVCSRLGEADEVVTHTTLDDLAAGSYDPLSVLVFTAPTTNGPGAWGLPEDRFAHRGGLITPSEIRAVALGKLDLPATGVLWDVGAGSGSVAVECARLAPGLRVLAVERDDKDCERIAVNALAHRVRLEVVPGEAPEVLAQLPDPDRAFVGAGGVGVLEAVVERLRPGGTVVATFSALDRAVAAWELLGNVVEISLAGGVPVGRDGTVRLAAQNPVFVAWGPVH